MKLNTGENYLFTSQMAMILSSGFSLQQGLVMIIEELDKGDLKEVLTVVLKQVDDGMSFSKALDYSQCFDSYLVNLIIIGENSGNLDDVMTSLSEYYFRIDDISYKLKQALTYPIILVFMMTVIIGIIVFKVLPIFQGVLRQLGTDLSNYANAFMKFGQVFSLICFIILIIVVLFIFIALVYQKMKHVNIISSFVQKSFLTKKLSQSLNKAQITYALSLFISSGYDIEEAMKYVPTLVDNGELKNNLFKCHDDLANGDSFVDVIKRYHIYQGMALNMVQVGFKTGQIDKTMKKLADVFQDEVSQAIEQFLNIIEPTIVALLSVIVGVVLLSVMLPLISIMASL